MVFSRGPLFPMQVVHPNPTRSNPSLLRYCCNPLFSRYWDTTLDPGAKLVLTFGLTVSPRSTAFFARSPAPTITLGLEVFVQLVMAAITTSPSVRSTFFPLSFTDAVFKDT